jgi:hypothetical protein
MALKARHVELARMLQRATSAGPDAEVAAEEALIDALAPYLDEAGYHTEDRAFPAPEKDKKLARPKSAATAAKAPAARAAASLAAAPAPKLVITIC